MGVDGGGARSEGVQSSHVSHSPVPRLDSPSAGLRVNSIVHVWVCDRAVEWV